MRLAYLFFISTLLFSCSSHSEKNKEEKSIPKNIKGVWNLKSREPGKVNPEGVSEDTDPEELFNTIEINNSTISFYRYPFDLIFTYHYQQDGNQLNVNGLVENYQLQFKDSSLLISETHDNWNFLTYLQKYERSRGNYNQDTVNLELLRTLKRDTINYNVLLGKWRLDTERNLNDGSEPIPLHFSPGIPHQLSFPNQKMDTTVSKQLINLNVNGKKRPFLIWIRDKYTFRLFPWHWESDDPEMIYYRE